MDPIPRRRVFGGIGAVAAGVLLGSAGTGGTAEAAVVPHAPAANPTGLKRILPSGSGRAAIDPATLPADELANVRAYGAAGDGESDDTAAIQQAIDSGAKGVYFPAGVYRVTTLTVSQVGQALFGDDMMASRIVRLVDEERREGRQYDVTSADGHAVVEVVNESVSISDLTIKAMSAAGGHPPHSGDFEDCGVRARGRMIDGAQRTSVDLSIRRCYISGWYWGVKLRGQGLTFIDNLSSLCNHVVDLDFPETWRDVDDPNQHGWYSAFRTFRFENNRTQANAGAFVRNRGAYATFIKSISIDGVVSDLGGQIFDGALCSGRISNFANDQGVQSPVIHLTTGSTNWTIAGGRISGRTGFAEQGVADRYPKNGILVEGEVAYGAIRDVEFVDVGEHAVRFGGPCHDIRITDVYFQNVGFDTDRHSCIAFVNADSQARIDRMTIRQERADSGLPIRVVSSTIRTDVRATGIYTTGRHRPAALISQVPGAVANDRLPAPPSAGRWEVGDIVWNSAPKRRRPSGWMCTEAGVPGRWVKMAPVA